jgi:hypothetical protein
MADQNGPSENQTDQQRAIGASRPTQAAKVDLARLQALKLVATVQETIEP